MPRRRGGVATPRRPKANAKANSDSSRARVERHSNVYKAYDWRPEGRDGESKKPAARATCDAPEILSRRCDSDSPGCGSDRIRDRPAAGLPCRTPRIKKHFQPRSPGHSPRDHRSVSSRSISNSQSGSSGTCDNRQCDASEKFSDRVSSAHSVHSPHSPHSARSARSAHSSHESISNKCSDVGSKPWEREYYQSPALDSICLRHGTVAPGMEPAGVITRNYDYPYPPEMHSIVRLDSYVKYQGVYNGLGQIVKESFTPRSGDVLIVKMPRQHPTRDHGYVEFFTIKHEGCHLCPGDLLLRVGKFVERNTWRYCKRFKLYQLTDEHQWLFIGMVDNFVNLLPVTNHGINVNHVDRHCRFFFPRRGDMVVHLSPPDYASQLEWFNPKTVTAKGDILVRMYIGEPASRTESNALDEVVEGAIEIYLYAGKGLGWIFMGRDDCWYKDGVDLLQRDEGALETANQEEH